MKKIILVVLMGVIAFSVTGCKLIDNITKGGSELGSEINEGYDTKKSNNIDSNGLTKTDSLVGEKNSIKDSKFKGDYEATYIDFSGKEFIFGGMKVDKNDLTKLTIEYSVSKNSGTISIYLLDGEEKEEISTVNSDGIYEFDGSSNKYIVIEGEKFNGNVTISVK